MKFVLLLLVVTLIVAIEAAPESTPPPPTENPGEHGNSEPCEGSSEEESGRKRREGLKI